MVLEKVIEILAEYKDLDPTEITAESAFADLGLDSLDVVEIIMSLEDEFNVTLEMNDEYKTVGSVVSYIEELMK